MNHITTLTGTDRHHVDVPAVERPVRRLRAVLAVNAATSLAAGVLAVVAAPWLADELGLRHEGWTRWVGAGLVIFAVDVASSKRDAAMREAHRAGSSLREIADASGISHMTVKRIVERTAE